MSLLPRCRPRLQPPYGDVAKNIQIPESMQRMMDKMSVEATLKQMGKLVTPAFVHELNAALNQVKKEG